MPASPEPLKNIIEAALFAAGEPLTIKKIRQLFSDEWQPCEVEIKELILQLQLEYQGRGVELKTVAGGYRFQVHSEVSAWVARLWDERPPRYSRALLETLALIAYKQPITRAEIENVRGVAVSSHIIKTLLEREWIGAVGHRDVPGKPALYATTDAFLNYFNLRSISELPPLIEIRDFDAISSALNSQMASKEAQITIAPDLIDIAEGETLQTK